MDIAVSGEVEEDHSKELEELAEFLYSVYKRKKAEGIPVSKLEIEMRFF